MIEPVGFAVTSFVLRDVLTIGLEFGCVKWSGGLVCSLRHLCPPPVLCHPNQGGLEEQAWPSYEDRCMVSSMSQLAKQDHDPRQGCHCLDN